MNRKSKDIACGLAVFMVLLAFGAGNARADESDYFATNVQDHDAQGNSFWIPSVLPKTVSDDQAQSAYQKLLSAAGSDPAMASKLNALMSMDKGKNALVALGNDPSNAKAILSKMGTGSMGKLIDGLANTIAQPSQANDLFNTTGLANLARQANMFDSSEEFSAYMQANGLSSLADQSLSYNERIVDRDPNYFSELYDDNPYNDGNSADDDTANGGDDGVYCGDDNEFCSDEDADGDGNPDVVDGGDVDNINDDDMAGYGHDGEPGSGGSGGGGSGGGGSGFGGGSSQGWKII